MLVLSPLQSWLLLMALPLSVLLFVLLLLLSTGRLL
jgi:hypothetical protein